MKRATTLLWRLALPRALTVALILSGIGILPAISAGEETKQEAGGPPKGVSPTKGTGTLTVRVTGTDGGAANAATLSKAQKIIEKRLRPRGVKVTAPAGTGHLIVQIRDLSEKEAKECAQIIEKPAKLELRLLTPEGLQFTTKDDPAVKPGFVKMRYPDSEAKKADERWLWVKDKAEMSGNSVAEAMQGTDPGALSSKIRVVLHKEYGEKMKELSRTNLGKPLAIVLDDEVLSAPTIQSEIGEHFEITGQFTEQQARTLSTQLTNPLENSLKVEKAIFLPSGAPEKP